MSPDCGDAAANSTELLVVTSGSVVARWLLCDSKKTPNTNSTTSTPTINDVRIFLILTNDSFNQCDWIDDGRPLEAQVERQDRSVSLRWIDVGYEQGDPYTLMVPRQWSGESFHRTARDTFVC
ncbi:hypothetical protein [Paraburkholderia sp.]|uniref:hypothetical protein n=1 Tax=Paraburkholderia sp. TaxID=1926495 RepID=UPI002AFDDEC3|nr:hypothetical protein [Paraburkholderia sp.]